jgi:polyhydroxybutyrate depolymerase
MKTDDTPAYAHTPALARLLFACATAFSILSACGGGGGSSDTTTTPTPAVYRFVDQSLVVDARTRTYTLNLPPNYYEAGTGSVPLVIALHGGGGSAAQFESSSLLTTKANAANFAVVYPNGSSSGGLGLNTWNGGGCCGSAVTNQVGDVNFIRQLIIELGNKHRIDLRRVYATGHSNGGIMSYRLACELSDRIAAIAPNAAALMVPCSTPARAVPLLHMHSKLDAHVPIAGGFGNGLAGVSFPPLSTAIARFVSLNACSAPPTVTTNLPLSWTRETYAPCSGGSRVESLITEDGGHAWPGGLPGSANGDTPSLSISANDELWAFFQRFALP